MLQLLHEFWTEHNDLWFDVDSLVKEVDSAMESVNEARQGFEGWMEKAVGMKR